MQVKVKFFASLRERLPMEKLSCEVAEGKTVGGLWEELALRFPQLKEMGRVIAFAVNQEYVDRDYPLNDNDEVAFIPPVSGGMSGTNHARS